MINVSELITDVDFVQQYTVYRNTGSFVRGVFTSTETTLTFYGTVVAANVKDVQMMPEGDRIEGLMVFYSTTDKPIYTTRVANGDSTTTGTSDQILWRGNRYRILQVYPYLDYGYVKAIGSRMDGN